MVQYPHVLRSDGRYQLVALTHSPVYSPADVVGYAVLTADGARVTEVLSLEQAHSYWQDLLQQDELVRAEDERKHLRATPRRRRR
jgi:hypothetical protein